MRTEAQALRKISSIALVILARVTAQRRMGPRRAQGMGVIVHATARRRAGSSTCRKAVCARTAAFRSPGAALLAVGDREHQKTELLKPAYAHWDRPCHRVAVGEPITVLAGPTSVDVATITEPKQSMHDSKLI